MKLSYKEGFKLVIFMKILFIYDFPLWGNGSGVYLRFLTQELVKKNHQVGIIAPEERRLSEKIKQYKVEPPQTPVFIGHPELAGAKRYSELSPREITDIYKSYLDATLEAVANFQPDIIHVNHLSLISWVARYIYGLTGVKYIITTHGSCLTNVLENKRYLPLAEDAVRHAKAITTVSKDSKDRFFDAFDEEVVARSRIIPAGIDLSHFPKKMKISHIQEKYNLKGKKVILFAGRLSPEKGAEYLISAADKIKGDVFIAGEGPKRKELESIAQKKGLKNVHFLGYLLPEELLPFYHRADVFVSPSVVAESFGLVLLEAMAMRTPVIATNKGALSLLLKDGQNGFVVKPRNSTDIAKKCNILLEDEELRKKMGENARRDVEEKFCWEKVSDRFENLYKLVTGENGKDEDIEKMKKTDLIKKASSAGIDFVKSRVTRGELIRKLKRNGK